MAVKISWTSLASPIISILETLLRISSSGAGADTMSGARITVWKGLKYLPSHDTQVFYFQNQTILHKLSPLQIYSITNLKILLSLFAAVSSSDGLDHGREKLLIRMG